MNHPKQGPTPRSPGASCAASFRLAASPVSSRLLLLAAAGGSLEPLEIKEDVVQPDDQIEVKSSSGSLERFERGVGVFVESTMERWCTRCPQNEFSSNMKEMCPEKLCCWLRRSTGHVNCGGVFLVVQR